PRRDRSGQQRSAEAVGLDVERERRQRDVDALRRLDLRVVEIEDPALLARRPFDRELTRDEALHEEAIRRLHIRFERLEPGLTQAIALLDERALRAEIEDVDGPPVERLERLLHAPASKRLHFA